MATRAARAPTEGAEPSVRVHARVAVRPADVQPLRGLLDLVRPGHRGRQADEPGAGATGAVRSQPLEGIDAAVIVGPRRAHRVAADEVNVPRLVRVRLSEDRQGAQRAPVPPPPAPPRRRPPRGECPATVWEAPPPRGPR